jgi:hypothetical protein
VKRGTSDFPLKIDRMAISDISELALEVMQRPDYMKFVLSGAPRHDLDTARLLIALTEYLNTRRVNTDFEVVLSE